ncbi:MULTISPECIES: acyl-CoA dehydrogenase family protein [unclassified Schaalia]|uniref:acyl-CoA dehydrogenase family protein n=1 Tax=unclassified Schaalia TaxID=2691889 RepID=UPI001E5784DD|nr:MULTISPECIES: acyl-CoA dehydrogenase family protein [unclassified Schaalia]MCD4548846.1 acyl-CoA/acyl-ACP dehydrogenase [Schaalia sp. lx-260]MCD4557462.1 acyl-CoA/acyl-ACP dehydrogenase [Schaalia sp. lx-100]
MSFLSDDVLESIHNRASDIDARNVFPEQDYADLKESGYFSAFVPKEYGGAGLTLKEIAAEQTRLSKAAPATALGINMHQIIVGLGRYLVRHGNERGELILREAAQGELFGFGISEPANDLVLFGSTTTATPSEKGGYTFTGTKIFTSLAPAWTRLLTFGLDSSGPDGPHSVFAVLTRDGGGFSMKDDWDTLGMRATQSQTTLLEGAYAEESRILTRCEPGPSADPVIFGIFAHFEILLAATYMGIGERAIEVAVEHVKNRRSVKNQAMYSQDPAIRWRLAEAALTMNAVGPQIRELATEVDEDLASPMLAMPRLSAVKNAAAEASLRATEQCVRACGGASYFNRHELSRLYRDVLAGLFQPSDQESLHGAWAQMLLGPIE